MDNHSLHSMVPGFNSNNPQERYIDKAMNVYTPQKQIGKLSDSVSDPQIVSLKNALNTKGRNSKRAW